MGGPGSGAWEHGGLSRIQTVWVRDLPVLSQVARLDVVQGAQGSTLVVQDPATGQLARADLGAAFGRAPVPLSSFRLEATGNAGGMVPLRIDGQDRQIEAGTLARLTQAGGTASAYLDGVAFAGNLVVLHHATPGGDAFLFATRPHGSGIDVFRTGVRSATAGAEGGARGRLLPVGAVRAGQRRDRGPPLSGGGLGHGKRSEQFRDRRGSGTGADPPFGDRGRPGAGDRPAHGPCHGGA
ncbi:hypothetical protein ACFOHS_22965 [Jhaorihella thermophila]